MFSNKNYTLSIQKRPTIIQMENNIFPTEKPVIIGFLKNIGAQRKYLSFNGTKYQGLEILLSQTHF